MWWKTSSLQYRPLYFDRTVLQSVQHKTRCKGGMYTVKASIKTMLVSCCVFHEHFSATNTTSLINGKRNKDGKELRLGMFFIEPDYERRTWKIPANTFKMRYPWRNSWNISDSVIYYLIRCQFMFFVLLFFREICGQKVAFLAISCTFMPVWRVKCLT